MDDFTPGVSRLYKTSAQIYGDDTDPEIDYFYFGIVNGHPWILRNI